MCKCSHASSRAAAQPLKQQPKMAAAGRPSLDRILSRLSISPCRAPGLLRRPQQMTSWTAGHVLGPPDGLQKRLMSVAGSMRAQATPTSAMVGVSSTTLCAASSPGFRQQASGSIRMRMTSRTMVQTAIDSTPRSRIGTRRPSSCPSRPATFKSRKAACGGKMRGHLPAASCEAEPCQSPCHPARPEGSWHNQQAGRLSTRMAFSTAAPSTDCSQPSSMLDKEFLRSSP